MKSRFHEAADTELAEAIAYYDRKVSGLGDRFLGEVKAATRSIERHPEIAPVIEHGVRTKVLNRFPYTLMYVVETQELFIVAVHTRAGAPDIGPIGYRLRPAFNRSVVRWSFDRPPLRPRPPIRMTGVLAPPPSRPTRPHSRPRRGRLRRSRGMRAAFGCSRVACRCRGRGSGGPGGSLSLALRAGSRGRRRGFRSGGRGGGRWCR